MIDFHCHLLPALDDGPDSVDESLAMARALADFGFREVHCTPHCIAGQYEISPVEVRDAVRKLQTRLDHEGIALTLRPGMEYFLDDCFERFAANLLPLGESRLVLCEAPPQAPPALVCEMASLIVVQGFIPLLAHPERSEPVWQILEAGDERREAGDERREARNEKREMRNAGDERREAGDERREAGDEKRGKFVSLWKRIFPPRASDPDFSRLSTLDSRFSTLDSRFSLLDSCLYQANLGAFTGFYGAQAQRRAYELLQRGVYSCFASDLHEGRSAAALLEHAREKVDFNPALQQLAAFVPPTGQGGSDQLAFW